ncbi:MAG: hypothetical protein NTY23_11360 [Chloroflexi bacterium]|nr:hypothetical protein [Chloroflexota bacterium]
MAEKVYLKLQIKSRQHLEGLDLLTVELADGTQAVAVLIEETTSQKAIRRAWRWIRRAQMAIPPERQRWEGRDGRKVLKHNLAVLRCLTHMSYKDLAKHVNKTGKGMMQIDLEVGRALFCQYGIAQTVSMHLTLDDVRANYPHDRETIRDFLRGETGVVKKS